MLKLIQVRRSSYFLSANLKHEHMFWRRQYLNALIIELKKYNIGSSQHQLSCPVMRQLLPPCVVNTSLWNRSIQRGSTKQKRAPPYIGTCHRWNKPRHLSAVWRLASRLCNSGLSVEDRFGHPLVGNLFLGSLSVPYDVTIFAWASEDLVLSCWFAGSSSEALLWVQ
jgi:hypothetical protein